MTNLLQRWSAPSLAALALALVVLAASQLLAQQQGFTIASATYQAELEGIDIRIKDGLATLATLPVAVAAPNAPVSASSSPSIEAASTRYLTMVRAQAAALGVELLTSQFASQPLDDNQVTVRVMIRAILTQDNILALSRNLEADLYALRFESFDLQPLPGGRDARLELNAVLVGSHDIAP